MASKELIHQVQHIKYSCGGGGHLWDVSSDYTQFEWSQLMHLTDDLILYPVLMGEHANTKQINQAMTCILYKTEICVMENTYE